MDKTDLEERARIDRLYDVYGSLLTERQRAAFQMHQSEDLSLAESAELLNMTRQGVHDLYNRAKARLIKLEDLLGFASIEQRYISCLARLLSICREAKVDLPEDLAAEIHNLVGSEIEEGEILC